MACSLAILSLLLAPSASAFGVSPRLCPRGGATSTIRLRMAEGGPPQYARRSASVLSNSEVGSGSFLLRVVPEDDEGVDYEPGHVLALEIRDPTAKAGSDADGVEEWMRGPYTVTRADDSTFDVLYRVVGKKTETFTAAEPGTKLQFGGKFKVPVLEGIDTDGLERVVLVSTGVGVGPQLGFVEKALSDQAFAGARIELYAGFRESADVCCADVFDSLAAAHPDRFSWTAVVSSEVGRTSDEGTLSRMAEGAPRTAGATHYHLVGNGSMVNEFKAGLEMAGVPDHRVTLEMYFNHKESARPEVVEAIGCALKEAAAGVVEEARKESVSA